MITTDFAENYIMHDSLIDKVEILENGSTIALWIDFAFWMQNGYNEKDPETGTIKVTFHGVTDSVIPENVNWDEISILEMKLDGDSIVFALINDMTDDYLEIMIRADHVTVTIEENGDDQNARIDA